MYLTGSSEALGLFEPNVIRLYDDGTHVDEVAADNSWSVRIRLPSADIVRYTYTNSGDPGKWVGLDVPVLRQVLPGAFLNGMLPLDEFGKVDLYGDPWHTDEEGNMMLAKRLAQII